MYVCMYVYLYVCMCVCACACVRACVCVCDIFLTCSIFKVINLFGIHRMQINSIKFKELNMRG